jgi:hypothetical protein
MRLGTICSEVLAMRRSSLALLALAVFTLAACSKAEDAVEEGGRDDNLSESSYQTWKTASTLHVGETIHDYLAAPSGEAPKVRIVHPFYVAASDAGPVKIHFSLEGKDGAKAQATVLAPIENGARATVATAGYDAPKEKVEFDARLTKPGTYLLVVSTHKYQQPGHIEVSTWAAEGAERTDAIVSPRSGAISKERLEVKLNPALANEEVELWASTAPASWGGERRKIATQRANGDTVTFTVINVAEGDDLWIVLPKKAAGTDIPLDTGTHVRLVKSERAFIRFDRVGISDFGNLLTFTGVLPFYEGGAHLSLRSTSRQANGKPLELGSTFVRRDRPGQSGMGYSQFDADISMPLFSDDPNNNANPNLPRNGEILVVGTISEKPAFSAIGCFEFCNDLRGDASCSTHEVACPANVKAFDL